MFFNLKFLKVCIIFRIWVNIQMWHNIYNASKIFTCIKLVRGFIRISYTSSIRTNIKVIKKDVILLIAIFLFFNCEQRQFSLYIRNKSSLYGNAIQSFPDKNIFIFNFIFFILGTYKYFSIYFFLLTIRKSGSNIT